MACSHKVGDVLSLHEWHGRGFGFDTRCDCFVYESMNISSCQRCSRMVLPTQHKSILESVQQVSILYSLSEHLLDPVPHFFRSLWSVFVQSQLAQVLVQRRYRRHLVESDGLSSGYFCIGGLSGLRYWYDSTLYRGGGVKTGRTRQASSE